MALAGADQAFSAALPDAPGPLVVARKGDRVVVALGRGAAVAALRPASTLGDSGRYGRARDALGGEDPLLLVDAPSVVHLIAEDAGTDPDFARAKPYLDAFDLLALGTGTGGDGVTSRLSLRVR